MLVRSVDGGDSRRVARAGEALDAEARAAKQVPKPRPLPSRDPANAGAGEGEDVKRLINPLRGRKRPTGR
jgi:hypothetical protein